MTRPSERFDWDKAIALFKGSTFGMYDEPMSTETIEELRADAYQSAVPITPEPASRCRKDLHDMTPENTYLNVRTGHRRCRACTKLAEQTRRNQDDERKRKQENDYNEEWPESPEAIVAAIHAMESESASPSYNEIPFEKWPAPVCTTVQPAPKEPTAPPEDGVEEEPDSTGLAFTDDTADYPPAPRNYSNVKVREDDLAKYRESDSPDTRLLADIATSLRILAGRSSTTDNGTGLREPAFMQEIRQLLLGGKRIQAIERYRCETTASLKEALDFVRALPEYQQFIAKSCDR